MHDVCSYKCKSGHAAEDVPEAFAAATSSGHFLGRSARGIMILIEAGNFVVDGERRNPGSEEKRGMRAKAIERQYSIHASVTRDNNTCVLWK